MEYSPIDGICIDVVFTLHLEGPVCQRMNRRIGVAERAADVNMRTGVRCDEPRIISAPGSGYLGDGRGSPTAGSKHPYDKNPEKDSHNLTLRFDTNLVNAGSR